MLSDLGGRLSIGSICHPSLIQSPNDKGDAWSELQDSCLFFTLKLVRVKNQSISCLRNNDRLKTVLINLTNLDKSFIEALISCHN